MIMSEGEQPVRPLLAHESQAEKQRDGPYSTEQKKGAHLRTTLRVLASELKVE